MLKKLFFYDFITLRHRLFRLLIALLICAASSFTILLLGGSLPKIGTIATVLNGGLTFLLFLIFIAFFVLIGLCAAFIVHHFYKSLFSNEGYLTAMLPARKEQLLLSKLLAGLLFALITLLCATVAVGLGVLLPIELVVSPLGGSFLSAFWYSVSRSFHALVIPCILMGIVCALIMLYTAISLGSLLFPRKRVAAAVLFSLLLAVLSVGIMVLVRNLLSSALEDEKSLLLPLSSLLLMLLYSGIGYFTTQRLFSRKFDLI